MTTPRPPLVAKCGPVTVSLRPTYTVELALPDWPVYNVGGLAPEDLRSLSAALTKMHAALAGGSPDLGVMKPVRRSSGQVTVLAWRDADKPRRAPNFFLDILMPEWPRQSFVQVSLPRLRALAQALQRVSTNLAG